MTAKSDEKDKFVLRFRTPNQRAQIKARAALNYRPMNTEILFLIDKGMEAVDGGAKEEKREVRI